jgi:hypothetical protein
MALAAAAAIAIAIVVGLEANQPKAADTGGVSTQTPDAKHPPQRDVGLDRCTIDATGVHVTGTVRNRTDRAADYAIRVDLLDQSGGSITSGTAAVKDIAAGAEQAWTATMPPAATESIATHPTCKVVRVDRFKAGSR